MSTVQDQSIPKGQAQESEAFTLLSKEGDVTSREPAESGDSSKSCPTAASLYSEHCPPAVKEWISQNAEPFICKASCQYSSVLKTYVTPNAIQLQMAHAFTLMVWGGSHYTLALLMAFSSMFDVPRIFCECTKLAFADAGPHKTSSAAKGGVTPGDLRLIMSKASILLLCFHAVWYSDWLSAITIAFCLERYITQALLASEAKELCCARLKLSADMKEWLPFMTTMTVRLTLVFFTLFLPHTQACLFFAVYGGHKLYDYLHEPAQKKLCEPAFVGLDTKTLVIWAVSLLSTFWQGCYGYESSVLNLFVPLGFLLPSVATTKTPAGKSN